MLTVEEAKRALTTNAFDCGENFVWLAASLAVEGLALKKMANAREYLLVGIADGLTGWGLDATTRTMGTKLRSPSISW